MWAYAGPQIFHVETLRRPERVPPDGVPGDAVVLVPLGDPDVLLRLRSPSTITGLFGRRRTSDLIATAVDDPVEFIKAM